MTKKFLTVILVIIIHQFIILFQKIFNLLFIIFFKKSYPKFKNIKNTGKNKSQVIFESNSLIDTKLAHYVTLKAFGSIGFDNFLFYNMTVNSFYNPKTFFFYKKLNLFNIKYFLNFTQILKTVELFFRIKKKVRSKKQLINLKLQNIQIGDLIYDSYLRFAKKPTINFNDFKFNLELFRSVSTFIFWSDYFKLNKVDSFIQSHANYRVGIPGKIAISKKIKVFNINIDDIYRLKKNKKYLGLQFLNYKFIFNSIKNKKIKKKFISLGLKKMKIRFKGGSGFDIPHTFKHAFKQNTKQKIGNLFSGKKNNILISCHDFTDSPNAYGRFIFKDFFEWIDFLGNFSQNKKNFNWYLKPHPNPVNDEKVIIKSILDKYPHFKLIPSKISHKKIIPNISLVLTCRGTIGYEYPYFNIPSIMASKLNKIVNFTFAYSAKNLNNYKKLLSEIPLIVKKYKMNREEIAIFYFTHYFLHDASSWLIDNYQDFYNEKYKKNQIGSSRVDPNKVLKTFEEFYKSEKKLKLRSQIFINFYKSNKYKLIFNKYSKLKII